MQRLREEFDADRIENRQASAEFPTTVTAFGIPCSVCGRTSYVDEKTKRDFQRAMDYEMDNTFTCAACEEEYEELAHQ